MKPLKLRLAAFGPYASVQKVDFADLKQRTFFLIHGRTGSGKTSLLDAMCYALYGDTSGNERNGRDMRSHHADPTCRTEVVFDFALGAEVYRVSRTPAQERPRKKGGGTTTEAASATLWRRTGADDEAEGTVLASQPGRVTEVIEELLGFASEQFRQVVILPQGQFRQLLMAESAEREKILESLFKTELYRRIELALKEAASEIKNRWSDARTRFDVLLQQAQVATASELEEQLHLCQSRLSEARAKLSESRAAQGLAQQKLDYGRQCEQRLKELSDAVCVLTNLETQKEALQIKRQILATAHKAAKIIPAEKTFNQSESEYTNATIKLAHAQTASKEALLARDASAHALQVEEGKEEQRRQLRSELQRLDELASKVEELARAGADLKLAQGKVEKFTDEKIKIAGELDASEHLLEGKKALYMELQKAAATLESVRQVAINAEKILDTRRILESACDELAQTISKGEQLRRQWENIDSVLQESRLKQSSVESSWFSGQAAALAKQLVAGLPCPVCGSAEHPAPAATDAVLATEADVKKCRTEVARLEKEKDQAAREHAQQENVISKLQSQVQTLTATLGDEAIIDIALLQCRVRENRSAVAIAEQAVAQAATVGSEIVKLAETQQQCKQRQSAIDEMLSEANEERLKLSGAIQERESNIPADLRELKVLKQNHLAAGRKLQKMEQELKAAQEATT